MDARSERRLVTCLFVDVVGSTAATSRLGPERMQRLLAEAFAAMSTTITDHGGTVEKYIGDAIFALFGAPVAHVDDPERALRAAEACSRWSISGAESEMRLAVRVGIETGEALVDLGAIDQRQRMAVGPCVTIAARLQQQADPGQIVVGPTCHETTTTVARFESMGSIELKGVGVVEPWRFVDFEADDGVAELPFIGREAELGQLESAAATARAGNATLAFVVGPPGQGKSRLVAEAIRAQTASGGATVLEARCRPGGEIGANTPLSQLLEADIGEVTPETVARRVDQLLATGGSDEIAGVISHSAGLRADPRVLAGGRIEQRDLIAATWRQYLAAVARDQLLIVRVEDLHWADPVLLRIIDRVTTDLDAPVLVLATARPEFLGTAHLRPSDDRIQIELAPLDAEASDHLARTAGENLAGLDRAAGNPLFIIELARARSTSGDLPLTIQAAIAARLDELSPPERELLQRASVAGETFDVRDAALLDDKEPSEVAGSLGRIAHLGFIDPHGSEYRFHHALVRDVAYARLPVGERLALHARYAEEGVDPADVEARAHHLWQAVGPEDASWVWDEDRLRGLRRSAFDAHIAAGDRLQERNQYEDAMGLYERAIGLAPDVGSLTVAEARAPGPLVKQGRGDEAWAHWLRAIDGHSSAGSTPPAELFADMLEIATQNWGYFQEFPEDAEVLRLLDEGERVARASGDDVSLARLLMQRATFTDDVAGADEITRFLDRADAPRFGDAAHRMAQVYLWNGEVDRAMQLYVTVFDRLRPAGAVINEPEGMVWYAVAAFNAGDLELAESIASRARDDAVRRSAHTRQHALGLWSMVQLGRGNAELLVQTAEELRQLVEANADSTFCLIGAGALTNGASAEILAGRPLPSDLDAALARLVPMSQLVQTSSALLPKVMAGVVDDIEEGYRAYAPGLRLIDRQATWDVGHLMPAIALTMLERWDQLSGPLQRLDLVASGGGRLAAAVAEAIREEQAASGRPTSHDALRELGYLGISRLLHYRP